MLQFNAQYSRWSENRGKKMDQVQSMFHYLKCLDLAHAYKTKIEPRFVPQTFATWALSTCSKSREENGSSSVNVPFTWNCLDFAHVLPTKPKLNQDLFEPNIFATRSYKSILFTFNSALRAEKERRWIKFSQCSINLNVLTLPTKLKLKQKLYHTFAPRLKTEMMIFNSLFQYLRCTLPQVEDWKCTWLTKWLMRILAHLILTYGFNLSMDCPH